MFKKYIKSLAFGVSVYAFVHSHPACGCHLNHQFSNGDRAVFLLPGVRRVYLAAPANIRTTHKEAFSLYDSVYRITNAAGRQTRIWRKKIYSSVAV